MLQAGAEAVDLEDVRHRCPANCALCAAKSQVAGDMPDGEIALIRLRFPGRAGSRPARSPGRWYRWTPRIPACRHALWRWPSAWARHVRLISGLTPRRVNPWPGSQKGAPLASLSLRMVRSAGGPILLWSCTIVSGAFGETVEHQRVRVIASQRGIEGAPEEMEGRRWVAPSEALISYQCSPVCCRREGDRLPVHRHRLFLARRRQLHLSP